MRVIIVGLGVQGRKRLAVAGREAVATVDPLNAEGQYRRVEDVPLSSYDAALLCIPDEGKLEIATYLLSNRKHLLVEKPLFASKPSDLMSLKSLAEQNRTACYTAYNHRFEPHFVRMKALIESGRLGRIYSVRMFYGNGTARLVRDSTWRDQGAGVLPDLGSHLLDTVLFWFGRPAAPFTVFSANRFENHAPDHVAFGSNGTPVLQLEVALTSWRNHFYCDIFAESGSAHISSLCKWGPSSFTLRDRKLPSGRPDEEAVTLVQPDPTWVAEYQHFKQLCRQGASNIANDIWINETLGGLSAALQRGSGKSIC
jgi:scyllo-inositol 2-dehydrogenase (NADP+)